MLACPQVHSVMLLELPSVAENTLRQGVVANDELLLSLLLLHAEGFREVKGKIEHLLPMIGQQAQADEY